MGFLKRKNTEKEARMKKFIVIALALFLAIPAISFAGSATSRWDLTIGGYIKADFGYTTQAQGADYFAAQRESHGGYDNLADEYGNYFSAGGETRLNFLIKGPDGWGAKTIGFVEGDFRGTTGGSTYGTFALRHAFMKMQWANDALTIGHTWQKWGLMPSFANVLLGWNMLGAFQKGSRQPQIMWDHTFNKNFNMSFGIISPTDAYGTAGGAQKVNSFTASPYPFFEGEFSYTSDACGKIGPWQMLFSLSGFYGWDRQIYTSQAFTSPAYVCGASGCGPSATPNQNPYSYDDKLETAWGAAFKGFIPIIPEKKGDKGGALSVSGIIFASQNPSWYMGPLTQSSYNRGTSVSPDYSYPRIFGGWGQVTYFFTDKFFMSGWYGQMKYNNSSRFRNVTNAAGTAYANNNVITGETQYIVNLSYDVNPAMRLGLEWDYIKTKYANYGNPIPGSGATAVREGLYAGNDGSMNAFRFGAWYFF
jgi:hypothetical protein